MSLAIGGLAYDRAYAPSGVFLTLYGEYGHTREALLGTYFWRAPEQPPPPAPPAPGPQGPVPPR